MKKYVWHNPNGSDSGEMTPKLLSKNVPKCQFQFFPFPEFPITQMTVDISIFGKIESETFFVRGNTRESVPLSYNYE